jgi:hypothetical protein
MTVSNFGTILLGIDEVSVAAIVAENQDAFESAVHLGGQWDWNRSIRDAREHLETGNIKGFEISASLGLSGWVLSESVRYEQAQPKESWLTPGMQPTAQKGVAADAQTVIRTASTRS